jgi:hypothetical protein
MSNSNAALCYTLGALFTVVALASFVELVFAVYQIFANGLVKSNHIYIITIYAFTQSKLVIGMMQFLINFQCLQFV